MGLFISRNEIRILVKLTTSWCRSSRSLVYRKFVLKICVVFIRKYLCDRVLFKQPDGRLWVFALRASRLELNSSMMLHGGKNIQSVKSANFVFRSLSPCRTYSRVQNKELKKRTQQDHKLLPLSIARVFCNKSFTMRMRG